MRRANVPAVSRAACHAAHILLLHSKQLLSSQHVLVEIESFAKDLDVQGPAYPYDSVCDFMVLCLRIANQDVRLYRLQMEEKVLSWLMESWRIGGERRTSMPLHTAAHIHALLESITGSSRRVRLQCGMVLPHSAIVDTLVEETRTRAIRDFQLNAHLPPFRPPRESDDPSLPSPAKPSHHVGEGSDLSPPRGRERRLSAFLLKSLEERIMSLESYEVGISFPSVERLRSSLDLAVISLCFEASLLMNGTQSNRRVLQAACKLLGVASSLLLDSRWKADERRLLLDALDPIIRANGSSSEAEWETLVSPGQYTGIRIQVLKRLLTETRVHHPEISLRRELQRLLFRSADVSSPRVSSVVKYQGSSFRCRMPSTSCSRHSAICCV